MERVLFKSDSDEWTTPDDVFESLDAEFSFNLDPCATDQNHKCHLYYTKEENGLLQNWGGCKCFVIPHIAKLVNGSRSAIRNHLNQTLL